MEYRALGQTNIKISVIGLGTMTWGQQNTEAEAHEQLDYALAQGVNFIDAAEMYPVPARAETSGLTETYIGTWLASRKNREQVVLATKVVGETQMNWIRKGQCQLDRKNILAAVEESLKRLQTDYIDLYQLHWPDRTTNYFGALGYTHVPGESFVPLEETLSVLADLVQSGKVRHVGLSNETPWGTMRFLNWADSGKGPRMVSVQNPYSLLNRSYEVGMAEISIREQCGLLAYSPLAFGLLSGKYMNGASPEDARLTLFENFDRYSNPQALSATERYVNLARASGLSPAKMALAFVNSRDFVTSNIMGATTMGQLKENIESIQLNLSQDILDGIDEIHRCYSNPAP